jgi:hypothetical protein
MSLMEAFENSRKWDMTNSKAQAITRKIGGMIALDEQPYSIVSNSGFQKLMAHLAPNYNIPSRRYFSDNVIPELYEEVRLAVQTALQQDDVQRSFTTDMWTSSVTNFSFLSLTGHWLTKDYERKSVVLGIQRFEGRHTATNIKDALLEMLKNWCMSPTNVHTVICDNAANMSKALREAQLTSVSCFAHSLQLVINKCIFTQQEIAELLSICRKIVGHFAHSPSATDELRQLQVQNMYLIYDTVTLMIICFYFQDG